MCQMLPQVQTCNCTTSSRNVRLRHVSHLLDAASKCCSQAGKGIADKVATLLRFWEGKYRYLWEQDKDAYMRHACCAC